MSLKNKLIFAIGYSTRKLKDFIKLLEAHSIKILVDVRTIPKSRYNPEFNEASLKRRLDGKKIDYKHLSELGGLRHAAKDSVNTGWRNLSFRGFADYMQTREFTQGLSKLMKLALRKRVAIMCAEGNPFRCHRSLIADALTIRGFKVYHISSSVSASEHKLTPFAAVKGRKITYPFI